MDPTGNSGDDQLLGMLNASGADRDTPRHWVHYIYCATESGADVLEVAAMAAGWDVSRVNPDHHGIIAERSDEPVNSQTVPKVRRFFEHLAESVAGGEYDGWEASAE